MAATFRYAFNVLLLATIAKTCKLRLYKFYKEGILRCVFTMAIFEIVYAVGKNPGSERKVIHKT